MAQKISVIIPAFNEEASIGLVLDALPRVLVHEVLVVNNGSTDRTAEVAARHGARVIDEPRRGYGQACLTGIAHLDQPDIVVFLDGDYSDFPEELTELVEPIIKDKADLVLGTRMVLPESRKALLPQARYGNSLAVFLIRLFFKHRFTDLGPFRAIRYESLLSLGMRDRNFGWTVEMQIKAVREKLRILEIPVHYRERVGVSKITGTVSGTLKAGTKILYTIFRYLIT